MIPKLNIKLNGSTLYQQNPYTRTDRHIVNPNIDIHYTVNEQHKPADYTIHVHEHCNLDMSQSSQSAPEYSLLLKKPPTVNEKKKVLTPPNLSAKKNLVGHSFQNCCYTRCKNLWLVVRGLFVPRNGIKMQFLGVVGFKSSTMTAYCLSP